MLVRRGTAGPLADWRRPQLASPQNQRGPGRECSVERQQVPRMQRVACSAHRYGARCGGPRDHGRQCAPDLRGRPRRARVRGVIRRRSAHRGRVPLALPGVTDVVVAEAHGCAAALDLLASVQAGPRSARVVGDNPLLIRHGAAVGRLRNLQAEGLMATAMAQATSSGWALAWALVGRESNRAAHSAASDGAAWARTRIGLPGCGAPVHRTEWR